MRKLSPADIHVPELAGQPIKKAFTTASGNGASLEGIKVTAEDGWFAIRPSGTEGIYKTYAESFLGRKHLRHIEEEALHIASEKLARSTPVA